LIHVTVALGISALRVIPITDVSTDGSIVKLVRFATTPGNSVLLSPIICADVNCIISFGYSSVLQPRLSPQISQENSIVTPGHSCSREGDPMIGHGMCLNLTNELMLPTQLDKEQLRVWSTETEVVATVSDATVAVRK
jgi:hypothetical protein